MFTGLIEELGRVMSVERGDGSRLVIGAEKTRKDLVPGSSIAVNGACLTVTQVSPASFTVDLSPETLRLTHLGQLRAGEKVNLERPLRAGDRLGGHWVSGHVDGLGFTRERRSSGDFFLFVFSYPPSIADYLVPKGSIAVEGISLTVAEVREDSFTVQVIPFTYHHTTLQEKRVGDPVNLEADLLAKYMKRFISPQEGASQKGRIDLHFLAEHGFLRGSHR
ncbi:MAG: riboflavin synthase [candidate division NC10 bacterium]|nr:riboflavin synthase [candidate division NC10 bacterium]